MLEKWIKKLLANEDLTIEESYDCLTTIFDKDSPDEEIVELLHLLQKKGETYEEIIGFAKAMKQHMTKVPLNKEAIDICGTGGTNKDRFNVSTAITFILAALDIPVAKHGNRGSKKPNGSFDFLEKLGISFEHSIPNTINIFEKTNLCFLFARSFHPAMAKVATARKIIGSRTIFNILGPLCNPAEVKYQIIGIPNESIADKLSQAIQILGTKKTLVIVGADGLDELSTTGISKIFEITPKSTHSYEFNPEFIGIIPADENEIAGKGAEENAALFIDIFSNGITDHKIAELICLNAGTAMYCFGKTKTIQDGYMLAQTALRSGFAWKKFQEYKAIAQKVAIS